MSKPPPIQVVIRDNETGELRLYEHPDFDTEVGDAFSPFIWDEGNYGCDCNRYLFFQRAIGADEKDDILCGDTRYSVLGIFQQGRLVYADGSCERWASRTAS